MKSEKQIQIPDSLFCDMCRYFMLDQDAPELAASISKGLEDKLSRIVEHSLYTQYKTAPTDEQKEKARLEYIERKGIPAGFRW